MSRLTIIIVILFFVVCNASEETQPVFENAPFENTPIEIAKKFWETSRVRGAAKEQIAIPPGSFLDREKRCLAKKKGLQPDPTGLELSVNIPDKNIYSTQVKKFSSDIQQNELKIIGIRIHREYGAESIVDIEFINEENPKFIDRKFLYLTEIKPNDWKVFATLGTSTRPNPEFGRNGCDSSY